ncbi:hypothetical protein DV737_g1909, partial [Chaetothyriales sp. CBS 132003]
MSAISVVAKAAATAMVPFTAVYFYPGLKGPQIFSYTTKNSATPLVAFPRTSARPRTGLCLAPQAGASATLKKRLIALQMRKLICKYMHHPILVILARYTAHRNELAHAVANMQADSFPGVDSELSAPLKTSDSLKRNRR